MKTYFRADTLCKDVTIALVGKYTKLEDSYAYVTKALQHAAVAAGVRLKIKVQKEESHLCLTNILTYLLHGAESFLRI
jgi:CTP synthase (UTP-ammonia lyase)